MMHPKKILAGAGDVGGARAILPVLRQLEARRQNFDVLDHGFLNAEAPKRWPRVTLHLDVPGLSERLPSGYRTYVFGTSVADAYPLQVARLARARGLRLVCVLDNWMSYRRRLEVDGLPTLLPDIYAVMDELAREEAVADGIPSACVRVVGQPAISSLADDFLACSIRLQREQAFRRSSWVPNGKKLIVFVSEPVEKDQGADERSPRFRGYTETTVLTLLSRCLQRFHADIRVGLVPHPREDPGRLLAHWETCRGQLEGGQLDVDTGRTASFIADGVCGMASLLLYEALLIGKPVLSLQPGLRLQQLEFLRKKGVDFFITEEQAAPGQVALWTSAIAATKSPTGPSRFHPEMELHRNAPFTLADLVAGMGNGDRLERKKTGQCTP